MGLLKIVLIKRMPRGYRKTTTTARRARYARAVATRAKYSIETTMVDSPLTDPSVTVENTDIGNSIDVVPATAIQGMRKVKHMQVSVVLQHGSEASSLAGGAPILWALVYVPAGQNEVKIPARSQSIYEPNQFVIASGIADADAGPIRINTPLARNLNSGDKICLTWRLINGVAIATADNAATIVAMCRYAITLN